MKSLRDIEAERNILGQVLIENEALLNIADSLAPEDFSQRQYQIIYKAMLDMMMNKEPIDIITLNDKTKVFNIETSVVAGLADEVATAANITYYSKIVRSLSLRRKVAQMCEQALSDCQGNTDIEDIVNAVTSGVMNLTAGSEKGKAKSMKEILRKTVAQVETAAKDPSHIVGLSSGLVDVDAVLKGFRPGKLYILAARPRMGKSAKTKVITLACGEKGKVGLIFNLEMEDVEMGVRYISGDARIDNERLESGQLRETDYAKMTESIGRLSDMPLYFDDSPVLTDVEIWSKSRRHKMQYGLDLVVVDYLQLVQAAQRDGKREEQVASISRNFKRMAKDLQVPVIVLAQLNRECEKEKRAPYLSDLRESGSIEQDADAVIFIHRPSVYKQGEDPELAQIIISKNRGGRCGTVDVKWEGEYTNFTDGDGF